MANSPPITRSSAVRDAVVAMARRLGSDRQLPTSRELAKTLRVSSSTLHPILKELDHQGILSLRHGKGIFVGEAIGQKTIGVVFGGDIYGEKFSPFWGLLLRSVREQAGGHHFIPRVYIDLSDRGKSGTHAQLVDDIAHQRLQGMILLSPDNGQTEWMSALGLPFVVFGGNGTHDYSVGMDIERGFEIGLRELVRRGCRRIALLGNGVQAYQPNVEAHLSASRLKGRETIDWSYETWAKRIPGAGSIEHCAYSTARRLIADRDQTRFPDALLSLDDTATRGAISAFQQAGIRPGIDIQIASITNVGSSTLELFASELITIDFDPAKCVRATFPLLSELMAGRVPDEKRVMIGPCGLCGRALDEGTGK